MNPMEEAQKIAKAAEELAQAVVAKEAPAHAALAEEKAKAARVLFDRILAGGMDDDERQRAQWELVDLLGSVEQTQEVADLAKGEPVPMTAQKFASYAATQMAKAACEPKEKATPRLKAMVEAMAVAKASFVDAASETAAVPYYRDPGQLPDVGETKTIDPVAAATATAATKTEKAEGGALPWPADVANEAFAAGKLPVAKSVSWGHDATTTG